MTSNIKPYPEVKSSGLPWCPEVPEHWELIPNRAYLRQRKVLVGERHKDYTLLSLTKGGVIVRDLRENKGKFSADMGTSQEVRSGELVMCLFDIPETPRTVGLSEHNGMITGAYTVFEVRDKQISHWLEQFYLAMDERKMLSPLYSGLRNTIQKPRFLSTKTPIPPLNERTAILRYLSHVNRNCRRLMKAKRKLIALLTEEKQAIIQRAVTRGLDPDAPLKDSDIKWLGKVPEHWEEKRAKYFFRETDERSESGIEDLMSVSHKTGVTPRKSGVTMFLAESLIGYKICRPDDIAINTMWAFMGALGVAKQIGLVSPSYGVYRPINKNELLPEFVDKLVRIDAYKTEYLCRSTGITSSRLRLYPDNFLRIPFLCPPFSEQKEIIQYLDNTTSHIDRHITRAEKEISLVDEYRTRLISDVITGKLDVRAAEAALPEVDRLAEADESDDSTLDLEADTDEFSEDLEEMEA